VEVLEVVWLFSVGLLSVEVPAKPLAAIEF